MSSELAIFEGETGSQLLGSTLGCCFEATCRNHGIREALVFPDEHVQLTFTQLRSEVEKLSTGLLSVGLKPGDLVVLWGANHSQLILSIYACAKVGLVFSNMSHSATAEVVEQQLRLLEAKCIICFPSIKDGNCYDIIKKVVPEIENAAKGYLESKCLPKLSHVIIAEDDAKYKGTFTLSEIFGVGAKDKSTEKLNEISAKIKPEDLACVQFTAGTTSEPKPVALSHYQLVNSCLVVARRLRLDKMNTIFCCPMPVFRSPVLCLAALSTLVCGTKVVYPAPLPPAPVIFQTIESQKCTCLVTNPIAFHLMLRMPVAKKFNLETLKTICLAGDHLPTELMPAIQKLTEIEDVVPGVFLTEAGCMPIFFAQNTDVQQFSKHQGHVGDHYQLKVVDFNGEPAKFGQPGEIFVKLIGGAKFLGYYKNSKATSKFYDENDWLRTGDVGSLDKDGFVSIMGQMNDVIFCKKKAIFPSIIEKHLLTHPWVIGVQIVGVPDNETGEKICACVVKKENDKVEEEKLKTDLLMMCKEEKLPEPHYVLFMPDFPRTAAKKVQKFKLKEIAAGLISK